MTSMIRFGEIITDHFSSEVLGTYTDVIMYKCLWKIHSAPSFSGEGKDGIAWSSSFILCSGYKCLHITVQFVFCIQTQTQHGCGKFRVLSAPCVYKFGAYAVCCLFVCQIPILSSSFTVKKSTDHGMNKQHGQ